MSTYQRGQLRKFEISKQLCQIEFVFIYLFTKLYKKSWYETPNLLNCLLYQGQVHYLLHFKPIIQAYKQCRIRLKHFIHKQIEHQKLENKSGIEQNKTKIKKRMKHQGEQLTNFQVSRHLCLKTYSLGNVLANRFS